MKTYNVELKRTSYITITVEAKDLEEAEFIAWQQVDGAPNSDDANWRLESIEEMK